MMQSLAPFSALKHLRAKRRATQIESAVKQGGDELMLVWGALAYQVAIELSCKENTRFVSSPSPGHWSRVRIELGRRLGHKGLEFVAEVAA